MNMKFNLVSLYLLSILCTTENHLPDTSLSQMDKISSMCKSYYSDVVNYSKSKVLVLYEKLIELKDSLTSKIKNIGNRGEAQYEELENKEGASDPMDEEEMNEFFKKFFEELKSNMENQPSQDKESEKEKENSEEIKEL